MLEKIKRLGAETAVYGVSTIFGRFLNFLLVPFYTQVLPTGEYGIVAFVFSWIAFLNILYVYGMESAYFKYSSTREIGNDKEIFSTPFLSLAATSGFFSGLILVFSAPIGQLMELGPQQQALVAMTAGILFLDTVAVVPFAALRMQHRATRFAVLKFLNIAVNVACNLVLLLVFHMGVEGIFLSGLIASASTVLMLVPDILRMFRPVFRKDLFNALLRFGLPYIPAGLAAMVNQVIDRIILRHLTDDATVGIYQANYRLGIIMMLVVSMIDFAWRPFFLSHADDKEAKPLFARVLTYVILGMAALFLALSFFIPDLIGIKIFGRTIIHPAYWSGLAIVPVILLAYLFLGVYNNLVAGIYIEKKTGNLPMITIAGALVNIGVNFWLIPSMGMMGAAIATLLSYLVMAVFLFVVVQRIYPVNYEYLRILKIAASAIVLYGVYSAFPWMQHSIAAKFVLLASFGGLMTLMRFFDASEMRVLAGVFRR